MIYSPVIIPTLNRLDHLKQCVESLSCCHNADKTEVFISVDYPPSEKYMEGHDQICDYLDNTTFRFKKLHVYIQKENLGINNGGKEILDNFTFLKNKVSESFDRWIVSEDDNVFAPGFLDFMNEALEKFKDDNTVFCVCGYRFYYNLKIGNNNFIRQNTDFNAWGMGVWRDKYMDVDLLDVSYLRKMLYNPLKILKLWRVSNKQVGHLACFSRKKSFKKGDNFLTLYMIDRGMTQIMPAKSLVRNIGWDDSGLHCLGFEKEVAEKFQHQEIDVVSKFEGLKGTGWEYFEENQRVIRDEDFQHTTFLHAFKALVIRLISFWK